MDSFGARGPLVVGNKTYEIFRLSAVPGVEKLPFSLKILVENILRNEDGVNITAEQVKALADWHPDDQPSEEIPFSPARVIMQDFTGVPCVVDLATMRQAVVDLGGDPSRVNPLVPAELVIDHSVQIDVAGVPEAFQRNVDFEYQRNGERYQFLRWGQTAFDNFKVVPPGTGIVHQVNIEFLARVVMVDEQNGKLVAYPDSCVGTDSHTTMVNGLGVLGWGVGGIEAEAAMLGQPAPMLIPKVVGFKLTGAIPAGATATDVVLTITERLRQHGVVGKFVEFYGEGVGQVPLANRATIGNMSPEFGSTVAIFPIDNETLNYLRLTGRDEEQVALVEAYAKEQGWWHDPRSSNYHEPEYSEYLELDLSTVVPSIAGPKRPQDRIALTDAKADFAEDLLGFLSPDEAAPFEVAPPTADEHADDEHSREIVGFVAAIQEGDEESFPASDPLAVDGFTDTVAGDAGTAQEPSFMHDDEAEAVLGHRPSRPVELTIGGDMDHGHVVIASITSCTNTSNPSVMLAAGLLAKHAVAKGLKSKPWVKTSMAPGSKVVTDYFERAGVWPALDELGFNLVGYGCATCIGNSGPLKPVVASAIREHNLIGTAVLSGNRNFEGRINPDVAMNYLASPPLVIAYALAGTMDFDFRSEPLGEDREGHPVYLRDIWPTPAEVEDAVRSSINRQMFIDDYADVFTGDHRWRGLPIPDGGTFDWEPDSTYVRKPPYFDGMSAEPQPVSNISGARVLALLGDSVTTDHISPAGSIKSSSPAGEYLRSLGVETRDFNSYGSRRGNHEVMIRGTFANIRLRNLLLAQENNGAGIAGGFTRYFGSDNRPATGAIPLVKARPAVRSGFETEHGSSSTDEHSKPRVGDTYSSVEERSVSKPRVGDIVPIYDAAQLYAETNTPLIVIAGKEYGTGSSRDWAAKGTALLGVKAVIAESFERIHRSNLIGMGVLPLQFTAGQSAKSLGLDGTETFSISRIDRFNDGEIPARVKITATKLGAEPVQFRAVVRIDTTGEAEYYRNGGILPYMLRNLAKAT